MKFFGRYALLIMLIGSSFSCTGLKEISADDPLFTGSSLEFADRPPLQKRTRSQAQEVLAPTPNQKFLWMRPALARYHMLSDSGRLKKFWRKKIKAPVLLSQADPVRVRQALEGVYFHAGYFQNSITYDTIRSGKKKATIHYRITLREPYILDQVLYPPGDDTLSREIRNLEGESMLTPGKPYSLDDIKQERRRIDQGLKEKGFINFHEDFLIARIDSVSGDHQVNLDLRIKRDIPSQARIPYYLNNIYIHDDYSLQQYRPDTVAIGKYHLISQHHSFLFQKLRPGLALKPGDLYTDANFRRTSGFLNNLPVVRYTNFKFVPDSSYQKINALIYMTLRKRYAYSAEFDVIFRSTNFFGPGITLSYTDRNFRNGGQQFRINVHGRFEMQVAEGRINPAYEMGLELNYQLPRLYPGFLNVLGVGNLAKTEIALGYNLFNRVDLYRLNSVYLDFGYRWQRSKNLRHFLHALEVIYTQVPEKSKSDDFKDYLQSNPGIASSFEDQFILGTGYELTYHPPRKGRSEFLLNVGADIAGNLLNGLSNIFNAEKDSLDRNTLLGLPYSQFLRSKLNFVYSHHFNENSSLVSRIFAGVGIPYDNSKALPYIKQFYAGGSNSLRSFIARSIGPGSETPPEGFRDLTGDIRLEWNAEYRFTFSGRFKGALFLDAGNIWLYNQDLERPDGTFSFSKIFDEVGVSAGWGLRWDFDFIVARLDFAYTLHTPYLSDNGKRWFNELNLLDPVLNIAVGYPF